jgi:tetratricopeptide (TPR) repeat protein
MANNVNHSSEQFFLKALNSEKKNDWQSAIFFYKSALKLRPNYSEAHHNLAIALRNVGQKADALTSALLAAKLAPTNPVIKFSLGVSLEQVGKTTEAISVYKNVIKLRPNYIAALSNLGRLLELQGCSIEAINLLKLALKKEPKSIEATINLANCYLSVGEPQKTIELLLSLFKKNKSIQVETQAIVLNSLGVASYILDSINKAATYFKKAIIKSPHFAEAHENLAQTLFFLDQYENGWVEYEWRWKNQSNAQSKINLTGSPWNGEQLNNKTLLIYAEQGFGDVIQFSRFLGMLNIRKDDLILACQPSLVNLLSTLSCIDRVININEKLPAYDRHVPLLSLPRLLNISKKNIPNSPYLSVKPNNSLGRKAGLKVGITWAGMPRHQSDPYRNRSCLIETFGPLLSITGINLFSLQTGSEKNALKKINSASSVTDLSHYIQSFEDTAVLIAELDLVITIDTAVAHLAGSLGKMVWVLLAKSSDWRWNTKHKENIWYPTARLYKQESPGDWSGPINEIMRDLKKLIP